ncbi:MAG: hypothetical protein AAF317_00100 [Pseudomonadota bacterium]
MPNSNLTTSLQLGAIHARLSDFAHTGVTLDGNHTSRLLDDLRTAIASARETEEQLEACTDIAAVSHERLGHIRRHANEGFDAHQRYAGKGAH